MNEYAATVKEALTESGLKVVLTHKNNSTYTPSDGEVTAGSPTNFNALILVKTITSSSAGQYFVDKVINDIRQDDKLFIMQVDGVTPVSDDTVTIVGGVYGGVWTIVNANPLAPANDPIMFYIQARK